jgi:hypothetical protein
MSFRRAPSPLARSAGFRVVDCGESPRTRSLIVDGRVESFRCRLGHVRFYLNPYRLREIEGFQFLVSQNLSIRINLLHRLKIIEQLFTVCLSLLPSHPF